VNARAFKLNVFLFLVIVQIFNTNIASAQKALLTGEIKGIGKTPVQFVYKVKGKVVRDTVYATNDRFTYEPKRSDDGKFDVFIRYPRWISFWYEDAALTLSGSADKPYQLSVKGAPENDAATRYNETIRWVYLDKKSSAPVDSFDILNKEQNLKTAVFIRANPSVKVSVELLQSLTLQEDFSADELDALYKKLTPGLQKSTQGVEVAERIAIVRNAPVKGKAAPDFKLQSADGKAIALSDYKGKYVLLDFWGHWCGPCIKAMPALKVLHDKHAGKLTIIGVAAEHADDRDTWLKTIEKHQANWVQVSELRGDGGQVNTIYNIVAFPTYFLLDQKGVVLGKANDLASIEQLVSGLGNL
jgi:thiol-disulfide isomerase/thioredoxin